MKAQVVVTLKHGVLDPAGKAVESSLHQLGFDGVKEVRLGKYIEVTLRARWPSSRLGFGLMVPILDFMMNPVLFPLNLPLKTAQFATEDRRLPVYNTEMEPEHDPSQLRISR